MSSNRPEVSDFNFSGWADSIRRRYPGVDITDDIDNNGRKKMLIIGKTGTGKSSLCNVISGHDPNAEIFRVSEGALSCTQATQFANVFFNKDKSRPCR